jgi:uncharacterized MAPEG superfamily protein
MTSATATTLTAFIAWALALLVWMEVLRARLVASGQVAATGFSTDNAGLSPFMQRLARAHANCVEGLPIFGGLMLVALATGRAGLTDPLAYVLLGARVLQSSIHLVSTSAAAVTLRFAAFSLQMAIGVVWAYKLLVG